MVGKYCERDCFTMARAERKLAMDACTVWFKLPACSSSAFNAVSSNSSHHLLRVVWSFGSAVFQPAVSLLCDGVSSLNPTGVATEGFEYFGAKLHPTRSVQTIRN